MSGETRAIAPQPGILDIAPYVAGESKLAGVETAIKLSANENPWGPSPKALAAYQAAATQLSAYPAPDCADLRAAIGEVHGLDPARIICGNGSDELIALLCLAYAGVGDEVVQSDHSFLLYAISAQANGATPVLAPTSDGAVEVDSLLAACTDRTRLIFVANPNNPTGTRLNAQEIDRLAAGAPEGALVVIDAAYAEFCEAEDFDAGDALAQRRENVVMTRTFSKIHGLAALRVGWLYGPDHMIDVLHRVRGPFNVNGPAQAAAIAAMRDKDYWEGCAQKNRAIRDRLTKVLEGLGCAVTPSSANFVLAEFGMDAATGAAAADAHLRAAGIIVRRMESYGFPGHLRISIGNEAENEALIAALTAFKGAA